MAGVAELFSDLFAYVLLFEQMSQQDEFQPSYEQVRNDIVALLEKQDEAARRQNILERDYQDARFAVVAWTDERILKHNTWQYHNKWNASPLQLTYYNTRNAGEEFFERLQDLQADNKEIRELYYVCLGLGFSGQYFLGKEDELKLDQIRHDQAQHLTVPVQDVQDIDKLTPQPYEIVSPAGRPIKRPLTHLLLKIGLALLVAVPLALFLVYMILPGAEPPAPPVAPAPQPPVDSKPSLASVVQQWFSDNQSLLACARVVVQAVHEPTGAVELTGRVASEAQGSEIRQGLLQIERITQVNETFDMIPRPFCEVIELLEPFKEHADLNAFGLTMQLNKQGKKPIYYQKENLIIDVQTPIAFASHLYVDYYTAGQWVGHLFPNAQQTSNAFEADRTFTVGALDGPQPWLISPPFGLELVTVIASKAPLLTPARVAPEQASAYLEVLRKSLESFSTTDIAVTYHFITTQDQP